jgi:hypothetical protein
MNYLKLCFFSVFCLHTAFSVTCLADNIAGDDKYVFKVQDLVIGPKVISSGDCYYWEPKELLVDNTVPNPVARISKTTTFTLTVSGKDFTYSKTGSMTVHYVKVEEFEGMKPYICQGSNLNLTAKLTDNVPLPEGWAVDWAGDGNYTKGGDLSAIAMYDKPNGMAKIKSWIVGSTDTARATILVVGFEIKDLNPQEEYCDGTTIDFYLSPLPVGTPKTYLSCFSDFTFFSETSMPSFGNPAGTTKLEFTPVNENLQFEIENAIWYGNVPNYCNYVSGYHIWATAKSDNGTLVKTEPHEITVSLIGKCLDGTASCCARYFNGGPQITAIKDQYGTWWAVVNQGTFIQDIQPKPIEIFASPNSQYYQIVVAEEVYHSRQYMGLEPSDCYSQSFLVDNILNEINKLPITGDTEEATIALANSNFQLITEKEINRSKELLWTHACSCSREYEAKSHLGEMYNSRWECTHDECHP